MIQKRTVHGCLFEELPKGLFHSIHLKNWKCFFMCLDSTKSSPSMDMSVRNPLALSVFIEHTRAPRLCLLFIVLCKCKHAASENRGGKDNSGGQETTIFSPVWRVPSISNPIRKYSDAIFEYIFYMITFYNFLWYTVILHAQPWKAVCTDSGWSIAVINPF